MKTVKNERGSNRNIASQNRAFSKRAPQFLPPTQLNPAFATDQLEKVRAIVKISGKIMIATRVISPGIRKSRPYSLFMKAPRGVCIRMFHGGNKAVPTMKHLFLN
jgi:hypothetical protein